MVGSTYVKQRTKRLESKYHAVKKQLESSYLVIQCRVVTKFYRENSEIEKIRDSLNRLIAKSTVPYLNNSNFKEAISASSISCNKEIYTSGKETIDWTRGRFRGDTLHIVVKNAQIVEKLFLTPQGNIILVKRKDLGLLARFSIRN